MNQLAAAPGSEASAPADPGSSFLTDPAQLADARFAALDPELVPYYRPDGPFGPSLTHPLVYMIAGVIPGWANRILAQKKAALAAAVAADDHHQVVFLHERPYRTEALVTYVVGRDTDGRPGRLADASPRVRQLAAQVWTDSENLGEVVDEWAAMLDGADTAEGLVIASEADATAFQSLPDELTVYRADFEDGGWSWTLDERVANFFASRFGENHPVVSGVVAKADVVGYITSRGEAEVIVPHGAVRSAR